MGGVGSWACEALARSAIGRITLVDMDRVSLTTTNRQMPALQNTINRQKVDVVAERLRLISPNAKICPLFQHINPDSLDRLLDSASHDGHKIDYVIDAIDQLGNKCALIVACHRRGIPVIVSTGAGGRLDPTQVRISDLAKTSIDPLARMVRVYLRKKYDFSTNSTFKIPAVYSTEIPQESIQPSHPDAELGRIEIANREGDDMNAPLSGDDLRNKRNVIMGTMVGVTSVFGMAAASHVIRERLK
jgi:tRNA A37 threonylcarbamoyladenosine dehydratase